MTSTPELERPACPRRVASRGRGAQNPAGLLLFLARSSRGLIAGALLASLASGLSVSLLVAAVNESLSVAQSELLRVGTKFAALSLGMLLFRWLSQAQLVRLSQITLARLRIFVSQRMADAPYRDIETRGAGRLLAVLTEDIATVAEFFVTLPRLVVHGAVIVGCLLYLAYLSWQVFGLAVFVGLLSALLHNRGRRDADEHLRRARLHEDGLFEHFRALFTGAKELKLSAARRAAFVNDVLEPSVEAVREQRTRGLRRHVGAASFRIFSFFLVIGSVIFVLGPLLEIEPRVRSGYALMLLYMMLPLHALLEATPALGRTRIALERIQAAGVHAPSGPVLPAEPVRRVPFEGLQLCEATHTYRREMEDGVFVLGPLSLELRPAELVFLIGGNGSGKTTLAKLLVGLYAPERGQVIWNGEAVTDATREAYRQNFSCVFSDFYLFESLLGMAGPELDAGARELLAVLDLKHKVDITGGQFSTTELSLGQRKRLALLVACLEDRPVYVFDEWAADQDPRYKALFYLKLLPELKARGKSVLVVTHDDRYFSLADRCLELEDGRLRTLPKGHRGPALVPLGDALWTTALEQPSRDLLRGEP